MRRAVVVFIEDKTNLFLQLGCLYTSLKHIQSEDTDLVVFGTKEALAKVPDDCIKVEIEKASDPPEFLKYRFINSISCLADPKSEFLDEYDYILRTDCDTFLTPVWNSYYPSEYVAGQGHYVYDEEVRSNLKRIAKHFHLRHQGIHNIGATHYGNARLVRKVSQLATEMVAYLLTEEFKTDNGQWPGWFKGVSNLYGCEIAVNHLVDNLIVDKKFDFGTASTDSVYNHVHLHSYHSKEMFSKFQFALGKYDHLSTENLDLNIVRDYCLYIALKSKTIF